MIKSKVFLLIIFILIPFNNLHADNAKKPESINFIEAAAIPLVAITAWESLFYHAKLTKNKSIYINAGAGGVGHMAIQLAKYAKAVVFTSVSSNKKAEFVKELGADHVFNLSLIHI